MGCEPFRLPVPLDGDRDILLTRLLGQRNKLLGNDPSRNEVLKLHGFQEVGLPNSKFLSSGQALATER